jgi:uncharacterized protein (TIGR03000 family)
MIMIVRTTVLAFLFAAGLIVAQSPKSESKAEPKTAAAAKKVKTSIKITVPQEDAELTIDKQVMKTPGEVRTLETPELEAGEEFEYDFVVKWMPNNYTTITRKKTVKFKAGEPLSVDLTKDDGTDKAFIRYVPTPDDIVKKMLELGKLTKDDTVFDLGCGDGRLVIAAAKAGAKKGVGIDLDPERIKESKANVDREKLADKVEIRQGDLLEVKDLDTANVVLMYLSDELGKIIQPKLMKDLKPGTRVVSHRFTIGDWKPDQTIVVTGEDGEEYTLHLWTVKANK